MSEPLPDLNPRVTFHRSPNRSTLFQIMFDVQPLLMAVLEANDERLEDFLVDQCRHAIRAQLATARHKVKGHP